MTTTDWITYKTIIALDGVDYEVEANVFIEQRETHDPYSVTGRNEKVTATVEGWTALPPMEDERHPHYNKLDSKIRFEVGEAYNT